MLDDFPAHLGSGMTRSVSPVNPLATFITHRHILRIVPLLAIHASALIRIAACI